MKKQTLEEMGLDFEKEMSVMRSRIEIGFKNGNKIEFDTPLDCESALCGLSFGKRIKGAIIPTNATNYVQVYKDEITYTKVESIYNN